MELQEAGRASLPSASGRGRTSPLLHPLKCFQLPLASSCSCVCTAWQVLVLLWLPGVNYEWKLQSPLHWALLKALEASTEHQVTGSKVTSCCFDAASPKENLLLPCSLSSFLLTWNTYLCSLQKLCTPLGCSGIYLGYPRQCWWSQSWFSAGLQVWLAQHCMSSGSQSGNSVVIIKGLSSPGLCCLGGSGDLAACCRSSFFGTTWCISCATPPCFICWWMV